MTQEDVAEPTPADAATTASVFNDPGGVSAREVETLLNAFDPKSFAFLVAPNAKDYAAILLHLRWAQLGSGELPHEFLYEATAPVIEQLTGQRPDHRRFQQLLKELLGWQLVARELDAQATQSIHDFLWTYQRYRLTDEASRLLATIDRAARGRGRKPSSTDVKHSLRTVRENLEAIHTGLRDASHQPREDRLRVYHEKYQDLARLVRQEFHDFKEYINELNHLLLEFGRNANPTSLDDLDRVKTRLESYVNDMLNFFADHSQAIASACAQLHEQHLDQLDAGHQKELLDAQDPITGQGPSLDTHPYPRIALLALRNYFRGGSTGTLEEATRRIQDSTLLTIQHLRVHILRLLERTHYAERLRLRLSEALSFQPTNEAAFAKAVEWAGDLFEPYFIPTAPFLGSPEQPGEPHQPRRYKEYVRAPLRGVKASHATGEPEALFNEEKQLVERIERFVRDRILADRREANLHDLDAPTFDEFRLLVEALKHSNLVVDNSLGQQFSFTFHDPRQHPTQMLAPVEWTSHAARFTAPDLLVRLRAPKKNVEVTPPAG